jgi:hypothetical protein
MTVGDNIRLDHDYCCEKKTLERILAEQTLELLLALPFQCRALVHADFNRIGVIE